MDPYSSDYIILYEKWQYYNDLIAYLEYEHERSLLEQLLNLSKNMSARLKKIQLACAFIVSKV